MRHWLFAPVLALALAAGGCAASRDAARADGMVPYFHDTEGYLARPMGQGRHAAVVMIHEWWGLNDQIKAQADTLAREGYVVLAADLMHGRVATTSQAAMAQVKAVDADEAIANLQAAVAYLRSRRDVDATRVASLGWCFGGGWSLKLLEAQPDLAAGVMYYGTVDTDPESLSGLPPLLGLFGAEDQSIPVAQVKAFDAALAEAGVPHQIVVYPGAGHAFANPTGGERYRPEAARDAWAKTLAFLGRYL